MTFALPSYLSAAELDLLASGAERAVYRINTHEGLLAKLLQPRYRNDRRIARRERAVQSRADRDRLPIAPAHGVVPTEFGPAQIVEAVRGPDGDVARPIQRVLRSGWLEPALLRAMNDFVEAAYRLHIPLYDPNLKNLVFGTVASRGGEAPAVFAVDGYGDRNTFPLKRWFRRINDRHLDAKFAICCRHGNLLWDPSARRFSNGPDRRTGASAPAWALAVPRDRAESDGVAKGGPGA